MADAIPQGALEGQDEPEDEVPPEQRIYITEAAKSVNRSVYTLRAWCRAGKLPQSVRPARTSGGLRYWTAEQLEGIRQWMIEVDMRPANNIETYRPTPERVEAHLARLRGRRRDAVEEPAEPAVV